MMRYLFFSFLFLFSSSYAQDDSHLREFRREYYANGNKAINKVYGEYVRRVVGTYDITCAGESYPRVFL